MPIGPKGKVRILIIDKDTEFSEAVSRVLGVHNYEVLQTKSFLKALDSCYEFMPHLILLDLVQNTPDAFTFLKELNSLHDFVKAPVLLTGFQPRVNDVKKAVSLGARDFLKKPLHNRTLISKIKKLTLDNNENELKTISPYTTQATIKIKITHQLENLLSIESPLRIRGKKHFKLILNGQKALEASTVSTINARTKNNEYKNIVAFDPLEGTDFLKSLEDLNLIYHLEDLLAEDEYSLLVMGPDMEGLDLLKIFLKRFNATFALSKEVCKYKSKDLVNYDSILFGYSGTKKDLENLIHLTDELEDLPLIVALNKEERESTPSELIKDCVVVPKPFNRNNILFNIARVMHPEPILSKLMNYSPEKFFKDCHLEFDIDVIKLDERGLVIESPSLISKNSTITIKLKGGLKSNDINTVDLIVKDAEFCKELKVYRLACIFDKLDSYQKANVLFHLHS